MRKIKVNLNFVWFLSALPEKQASVVREWRERNSKTPIAIYIDKSLLSESDIVQFEKIKDQHQVDYFDIGEMTFETTEIPQEELNKYFAWMKYANTGPYPNPGFSSDICRWLLPFFKRNKELGSAIYLDTDVKIGKESLPEFFEAQYGVLFSNFSQDGNTISNDILALESDNCRTHKFLNELSKRLDGIEHSYIRTISTDYDHRKVRSMRFYTIEMTGPGFLIDTLYEIGMANRRSAEAELSANCNLNREYFENSKNEKSWDGIKKQYSCWGDLATDVISKMQYEIKHFKELNIVYYLAEIYADYKKLFKDSENAKEFCMYVCDAIIKYQPTIELVNLNNDITMSEYLMDLFVNYMQEIIMGKRRDFVCFDVRYITKLSDSAEKRRLVENILFDYENLAKINKQHKDINNVLVMNFAKHLGLEVKDTKKRTPLHVAVKLQHTAVVEFFLQLGMNPYVEDEQGETPIDVAKRIGNDGFVVLLQESSFPKLFVAADGGAIENPKKKIFYALRENKLVEVRQILEDGMNPDVTDEKHRSLLELSILTANVDAIKLLLEFDADVNLKDKDKNNKGNPCLNGLCLSKNPKEIFPLLETSFNLSSEDLWLAMKIGIVGNNLSVINLLLEKYLDDIDLKNNKFLLHAAARSGCFEVVNQLVEAGASPMVRCDIWDAEEHNLLPLECVSLDWKDTEDPKRKVFYYLQERTEVSKETYVILLQNAILIKNVALLRELLIKKKLYNFDINHCPDGKQTVLFFAIKNADINVVKLLVEYGADINFKNKKGVTAAHLASDYGKWDILAWLKDKEVNNKKAPTDFFQHSPKSNKGEIIEEIAPDTRPRAHSG